MASYSYRTWETINLPTVNTDTYFIILDHAASGDPSSVTNGVIYSGLIMKNYGIKNLNEILSQHIYPQEVSFSASGYTQLDTGMTKTFYVYYTYNDWASWTNDEKLRKQHCYQRNPWQDHYDFHDFRNSFAGRNQSYAIHRWYSEDH